MWLVVLLQRVKEFLFPKRANRNRLLALFIQWSCRLLGSYNATTMCLRSLAGKYLKDWHLRGILSRSRWTLNILWVKENIPQITGKGRAGKRNGRRKVKVMFVFFSCLNKTKMIWVYVESTAYLWGGCWRAMERYLGSTATTIALCKQIV